jgi:hypothetical protein
MDIKHFLLQIPYLCKAKNAARWSRIIELQYEDELAGGSVFDKSYEDIDNPVNRIETVFGFNGDYGRTEHCKKLVELLVLCHYRDSHGEIQYQNRINELTESAFIGEQEYPDIESLMSAEQAESVAMSKAGTWNI